MGTNISFGGWVKLIRTARGMKQSDLAQAMTFDQSMVSRIEANQVDPTSGFLLKFSDAMKIDIEVVRRAANGDFDMSVIDAPPVGQGKPAKGALRDLWDIVGGLHADDLKTLLHIARLMRDQKD